MSGTIEIDEQRRAADNTVGVAGRVQESGRDGSACEYRQTANRA
jgi:hypothetical protein